MELDETELIFSKEESGNSLFQLKNGKIIFYNLLGNYKIYIFDDKTYKTLFTINMFEFIKKYEQENNDDKSLIQNESKYKDEHHTYNNKNSLKELDNGLILIGGDKYLMELNLQNKAYDFKIKKRFNDTILDINELPDKKIMVITDSNIFLFQKEKEEYIIKTEYPINENWKLTGHSVEEYYEDFTQYFSSELLPNNRLLLNSFSREIDHHGGCGTHPAEPVFTSKIIFINLDNFKTINSTRVFHIDVVYLVFENIIIIQDFDYMNIYDINSLEFIRIIHLFRDLDNLFKYDNKHLLLIRMENKKSHIIVYKINNKDLIEYKKIKIDLPLHKNYIPYDYFPKRFLDRILFVLKNKKIIVFCKYKMFLVKMKID